MFKFLNSFCLRRSTCPFRESARAERFLWGQVPVCMHASVLELEDQYPQSF